MIQLRLLGALGLRGTDGSSVLSVLSQPKRMGLLAFLAAAHPRGFHSRDKLLALLWPESDEEHARSALRQAIHFLRRSLGNETIVSRGEDLAVAPSLFACDVVAFDEAVEAEDWSAALELYRGPFLEGFHVAGAPDFDQWLETERERLRLSAVRCSERLSAELEAKGDLAGAVDAARRGAQLSPANGRTTQRLMELLAVRGDRAGAVRVYEAFKLRLSEDFGLEPGEEIRAAVERIRGGEGVGKRSATEQGPKNGPEDDRAEAGREALSTMEASPSGPTFQQSSRETGHTTGKAASGALPRPPARRSGMGPLGLAISTAIVLSSLVLLWVWAKTREDPRAPVFLTGFTVNWPDSVNGELASALKESVEELMDSSSLVRPSRGASYAFLQEGEIGTDSIRVELSDVDPDVGTIATWAYKYSGMESLGPIAGDLVSRIEVEVAMQPDFDRPSRGGVDPVGEDAYRSGRGLWDLRRPELFEEAKAFFQNAVDMNPRHARAYAALADVYNLLGAYDYGILPPDAAYSLAKAAADSAFALNPDLSEVMAALATTQFFFEWDLTVAESLFRSAILADRSYAHAHHWLALLLAANGRFDEAMDRINEAMRVDSSYVMRSARARIHYFAGRYPEAIAGYEEALWERPDFTPALLGLGLSFLMNEDYPDALAAYERAEAIFGRPVPITMALKGHLLGQMGDREAAESILAGLEGIRQSMAGQYIPPEYFAMVHLGLGQTDEALRYLEIAFENGSNSMTILRVDPLLDPLRGDPRLQTLIDSVAEGRRR